MRVCALVASTHVVPGRTSALSGCNGPEARRRRTVTSSAEVPGLKTSSSDRPPDSSWPWGTVHCAWGLGAPGTTERPLGEPDRSWTSDATMRPVRACTTVETVDAFCTSLATFTTWSPPGGNTIP